MGQIASQMVNEVLYFSSHDMSIKLTRFKCIFYSIRYVPEPGRFKRYCLQCNGINDIASLFSREGRGGK